MEIFSEVRKGILDAEDLSEAKSLKGNVGVCVDLPYRYASHKAYEKALLIARETRAKQKGLEMSASGELTIPRRFGRIL